MLGLACFPWKPPSVGGLRLGLQGPGDFSDKFCLRMEEGWSNSSAHLRLGVGDRFPPGMNNQGPRPAVDPACTVFRLSHETRSVGKTLDLPGV